MLNAIYDDDEMLNKAVKIVNYIREKLGDGYLISGYDYNDYSIFNLEWVYTDAHQTRYSFKKNYSLEYLSKITSYIVLADDFIESCKKDAVYLAVHPVGEENKESKDETT